MLFISCVQRVQLSCHRDRTDIIIIIIIIIAAAAADNKVSKLDRGQLSTAKRAASSADMQQRCRLVYGEQSRDIIISVCYAGC